MTSSAPEFRSKSQREKDVDLARNYRQIGISAIAAANDACCKGQRGSKRAEQPSAPRAAENAALHLGK